MNRSFSVGVAALAAVVVAGCGPQFDIKKFKGSTDELYAASLHAFQKHHWEDAAAGFEKLTLDLPAHDTLVARSYYYLGESHRHRNEPLLAAQSFSRLAEAFPDDSLAAPALFAAGQAYERMWHRPDLDADVRAVVAFRVSDIAGPVSDVSTQRPRGAARRASRRSGLRRRTTTMVCTTTTGKRTTPRSSTSRTWSRTTRTCPRPGSPICVSWTAYRAIRYKEDAADVCRTLVVTYPQDALVHQKCEGVTASAQPAPPPS